MSPQSGLPLVRRLSEAVASALVGATLEGSSLRHATLVNAKLSRAQLVGADLTGARLHGALATDANFERRTLQGADFSYARLSGARFEGARFIDVNLNEALLFGTDFRQSSQSQLHWGLADTTRALGVQTRAASEAPPRGSRSPEQQPTACWPRTIANQRRNTTPPFKTCCWRSGDKRSCNVTRVGCRCRRNAPPSCMPTPARWPLMGSI